MQQERYVSTITVTATVLWVTTGLFLTAAAILAFAGEAAHPYAVIFGFTAATMSSLAAVAHIKLFAMKTTALIRLCNRLELDGPPNTPPVEGNRPHLVR